MEPKILTEPQEISIRNHLIEAGYTNPDEMIKTAHAVVAGVDRVERDGVNLFAGEPGESMFSVLLFVDKGNNDFQHYSTRASWQWPSPILDQGVNIVVNEYHAEKGGIPDVHRIKEQLMNQVDRQNNADLLVMTEPLKTALEVMGIPGSTVLLSSDAHDGAIMLGGVRKMNIQGSETVVLLKLIVMANLSGKDETQPFIGQVTVIPNLPSNLATNRENGNPPKLQYHYGRGPIPDMKRIEQDLQELLALPAQKVSPEKDKNPHSTQTLLPPSKEFKKGYKRRH